MKRVFGGLFSVLFGFVLSVSAQTLAPTPAPAKAGTDSVKLELLVRKIDEQNAKIDILSQQILKLEQQIASTRPGVMIGEPTPGPTAHVPSTAVTTDSTAHSSPAGNTHTVSRGETLTAIAKQYGVTISDLKRINHIEDERKLQVGQTLTIPAPGATPMQSATAPPN